MGDTCWVTQATLDTFVPGSTFIQHHLNQFQVDCGHMQTKLCARQALWVAVGTRWWRGMVWWQAMARQSRSATVRVLLLSDAAATTLISTTKLLGTPSKIKNDIIWEFFPNVGPPPLLGTPYHNGPFGAKNGRTWQACRCPKAV